MDEEFPDRNESLLLESAKLYLKSLVERKAPDSFLSAAWEEFYRVYSDLIRRFVIASGVRGDDVDDCVQDVWGEVLTRFVDFQYDPNRPGLRAWLYTLVRSKATDMFRRTSRCPTSRLGEAIESGQEPVSRDLDPADRYALRWELALVQTLLLELRSAVSELNYTVLHMRLVEGHEVAQVAAALGLAPEQVRYRQHRMLEKLRARAALYTGEHLGASD